MPVPVAALLTNLFAEERKFFYGWVASEREGMTLSFLLFVACGLIFLEAFGIGIADAGGNKTPSDPNRLPVKFRFWANYDPGHGGLSREFILERRKGKFLVNFCESRYFPRPGEKDFKPETGNRTEERTAEESERFFDLLVNDLKIEELGNLKARVLLHPTYYDFEMRYADDHVHRFEYVIEAGHHLDERYGQLVDECNKFLK